jgi:dipeptidyl aminopeptidase/acylaminoacyl peptidase
MKGPGFVGALPQQPSWSLDGTQLYYFRQFPDSLSPTYYVFSRSSKQTTTLSKAQWEQRWCADNSMTAHGFALRLQDEALHVRSLKSGQQHRFRLFSDAFWNPQVLLHGQEIALQRDLTLYSMDLQTGAGTMLVSYQNAKQPVHQDRFLSDAELSFFESEQRQQKLQQIQAKPHVRFLDFTPSGALQIDPSARFVILRQELEPEAIYTEVPHYIATDGHVFTEKARPKVQNEASHVRIYIHHLQTDSLVELDFSGLPQMGQDRQLIVHPFVFSKNKPIAVLDLRSSDHKDRWIVCVDLAAARIQLIDHQHDEAWIGGPGISSWSAESGTLDWLDDAKTLYFQSEQTGYSHLYVFDLQAKQKIALTTGSYEVHGVQLSHDHSCFYLTTNCVDPGTRSYSKLDLKTLQLTHLLKETGAYEVALSPDESQLAYRFSTSNQPWELFLAPINKPTQAQQLTHATTAAFLAYAWKHPAIIQIPASDGLPVYARIYEPEPGKKNGAAVLFVHGAGYLQNAHHYWSYYEREYMFHHLLTEQGYTVLDVDYRASEGYGRDYRTAIYRHMGGRDLQDYLDAKTLLVNSYAIDSNRVGIYGGSYGGFITLMALFTKPNTFACGAALRAVTDWAHYNHEYTSNILNTPEADPQAYRQSSPIYFAEGLQDPLLILHGMIDDNVQFQDVVRLNQRLIELGKKDYWMALYPVERHSFKYTSSWTDEYRRIFELFETYLAPQK